MTHADALCLSDLVLERVAERENCPAGWIRALLTIRQLGQQRRRVMPKHLATLRGVSRQRATLLFGELVGRGWLENRRRADRARTAPGYALTADGLLIIGRIERELRTQRERMQAQEIKSFPRAYRKKTTETPV